MDESQCRASRQSVRFGARHLFRKLRAYGRAVEGLSDNAEFDCRPEAGSLGRDYLRFFAGSGCGEGATRKKIARLQYFYDEALDNFYIVTLALLTSSVTIFSVDAASLPSTSPYRRLSLLQAPPTCCYDSGAFN